MSILSFNEATACQKDTHIAVVLAAYRVGRAGVAASDTDDVDGGASQADEDVQVLEDDTEQTEDRSHRWVAGLYNALYVSL